LLLGAGFIVGGYCPGTSAVGAATGKTDAWLFIGGLLLGSVTFTLAYDTVAPLQNSTAWGRVLLHEYFHLPSAVMVFAVVLFAIGCFFAVGKIEAAVRRSVKS
jgi:hypothetical protein